MTEEMVVAIPSLLENIEREVDSSRRNSTGSLCIHQIAKYKVSSRYLSGPIGSCHDACKAVEQEHVTNVRTLSPLKRPAVVAASGKIPEPDIPENLLSKKPLSSSKLPVTKIIVGPVNHQSDSKLKPMQENANSMSRSYKPKSRRYSDIIVPGGSPVARDSPGGNSETDTKQIWKKNPLSYSKQPVRFKRLTTFPEEEMPACTNISMPANRDKILPGESYLRRNSTGNLGIKMGESKDLTHFPSGQTGCRQENCKDAVERNLKTKARTLQTERPVKTSGEASEKAKTVKLLTGKKPTSSSKLPNLKSRTTFQASGQKITAGPKVTVSLSRQNDSKLKTLEVNASSMSRGSKLTSGKYTGLKGGSLLDGANSRSKKGNSTDKDTGSSKLSMKKNAVTISHFTSSSVKRVSSKKLNNNSPGKKLISGLRKTGKVRNEDDVDKVPQLDNSTSLARTKTVRPNQENLPNRASQLNKGASFKQVKKEQGNNRAVSKQKLHIREMKSKSSSILLSRETQKSNVTSLDRHGSKGEKKSSPLHSPSPSLHSDGSSSRKLRNRKSSLSSNSQCESFDGDSTVSISKKDGITSQNHDIKAGGAAICDPKNLKFRRGKIINVQSEKVSPRRLKFRPAKILDTGEIGSAPARGRSARRLIADTMSTVVETMKFNLRRQTRRDKKEVPILFNNVIEETATKLVEARRSKVKALVGAFETIISLQDPKSSPQVVWK